MGIFDSDDSSEEEVQISPNDGNSETARNESKLKSEVESKVVSGGSRRDEDSTVLSVASGSQVSRGSSSEDVSVEDVYRQNERIIELLEEITGDSKNESKNDSGNEEFDGELNGVL